MVSLWSANQGVLRGACNVEADLFVVRSVLELDGGVG